ncbi:hypothetical protein [Serratia sp. M24T3]|uniref:hypothetical protein n=1 Tax=Serratia sp. M24T3 TaxID=932213 RepID=UPI00025B932A|nr:hypothetical protein [Serratia sp. M24T3]EIC84720.1 hypothetical protein SPM24T3_09746 [Serratia sp. M24T3]
MITHQQQPTYNTCMCACIAMVVGLPVQEVIDKWHEHFHAGKGEWLDDALDYYGKQYFYGHPRKATITNGFIYFLTVPSLNIEAGMHQVLCLALEGNGVTIYDPAKGRENARYYVAGKPHSANEVQIKSWLIDLILPIAMKEQPHDQ